MSPDVPPSRAAIGATLRDARRRYGLEVREVEERTKIRARYIRALENEDWETLPAPAYIRGFLRTYGQLLGLDGEMLADEFRRAYGEGPAAGGGTGSGGSEPLLRERRRPAGSPSRAPLVIGVIAGIVVLLVALWMLGGGDDGDDDSAGGGSRQAQQAGPSKGQGGGQGAAGNKDQEKGEKTDAEIETETAIQVCLVAGGDEALIDSQQLPAGASERFEGYKNYRLDVGPGSARFTVGGETVEIEAAEPLTYEADSSGISPGEPGGGDCP